MTRLYAFDKNNLELLRRAVKVEAMSASWRDYFQRHIDKLTSFAPKSLEEI